jgi:hypothetical protein
MVLERVRSPSEQGFEACCGFKDLQQSPTSFWYYHNPFVRPYTVSITIGPHVLQGFVFTPGSLFTITRITIHGFTTSIHGSTTSIGLQHFQQICRVSMLPTEVPQPLQQPMFLYKPLSSFVALYTQLTSNRCCDLYTTFQRLYHSSLERYLQDLKWVFRGISFGFLV